jgi:hypothetical protein
MRRGLVSILGFITLGVGIWLITTQGSKNDACNASLGKQSGMGPVCSHIVFSYFGGFGLIGAGVIMVGISAVVMKRKGMRARRGKILLDEPPNRGISVSAPQKAKLTGDHD